MTDLGLPANARLQDFSWSFEAIAYLKELNAEGFSCSQMARHMSAMFHETVSRNAVIGKLYRMGLAGERSKKPRVATPRADTVRKKRIKVADRGWQAAPRLVPVVEPAPIVDDSNIPIEQRRQIHELEHGMCRFPCGDPAEHETFFFCAAPKVKGGSYCPTHHARCYSGFGRVR